MWVGDTGGKLEASPGWLFDTSGRRGTVPSCRTQRPYYLGLLKFALLGYFPPGVWTDSSTPWGCGAKSVGFAFFGFSACAQVPLRSRVGRKEGKKFLAVKTPGSPGSLLARIQLCFYLIYILRVSFKLRVHSKRTKKKRDRWALKSEASQVWDFVMFIETQTKAEFMSLGRWARNSIPSSLVVSRNGYSFLSIL